MKYNQYYSKRIKSILSSLLIICSVCRFDMENNLQKYIKFNFSSKSEIIMPACSACLICINNKYKLNPLCGSLIQKYHFTQFPENFTAAIQCLSFSVFEIYKYTRWTKSTYT